MRRDGTPDRGGILPALLRHGTPRDRRQRDLDVEEEGRVMAQAFSPTEIFKRATASTLRAIAERDERTESTMAEAVRLLTREALTHEPPPVSARHVVDLWRPWLEGKIGKDIADLDRAVLDQDTYARATRRLIQDLDLDLGDIDDSSSEDNQGEGEEAEGENENGESASAGAQPSMEGAPTDSADAD